MAATYQTIAASIRQRISSGELRPGDRVPSTRAITREWGVAVATATKALAALQAEGLVRGVVGVGTVVAQRPRGAPQGTNRREPDGELNRERIVVAAVALADREGLAAVTMRRLATELDVAAMSLYRHVPGKDELVVFMADHIFSEITLPDAATDGWRAQIESVLRLQWTMVKAHPWLPSVMSFTRPLMVPAGMAQTDHIMGVVGDLGFDPPTALHITVALAGLLLGVGATVQMEAEAQRDTGMTSEEWMDRQDAAFQEIAAPVRFPNLASVAEIPGYDMPLDEVFEIGLNLILDGLAQRIPRAGGALPR
jgi:DNA-binding GntR family transcriptional regulator